jgi:hypothetical protein
MVRLTPSLKRELQPERFAHRHQKQHQCRPYGGAWAKVLRGDERF